MTDELGPKYSVELDTQPFMFSPTIQTDLQLILGRDPPDEKHCSILIQYISHSEQLSLSIHKSHE